MGWKQDVAIDLAFDCNPVGGDNEWDVADQKMDRINAFLANPETPTGTTKPPRFAGNVLYVRIEIPDVTLLEVASLYNNVQNFVEQNLPPDGGPMPKYHFIAEGFILIPPEE